MPANLPGDLFLWLAFVFNLVSGAAFFLTARGNRGYQTLALRSYHLLNVSVGLAVIYLYILIFTHDFSIKYVFDYSDLSLPFFYLVSAFWAGQEGTYLLWLFLSALFGYIIIKKGGQYRLYGMVIYSLVNLFFLTLLVNLSPFAMLDARPPDGAGLNPLLQDPWMVIHPPVIFIGYAMAAVPFALALTALLIRDYTDWVKRAFPWAAITALMLAGGNILGGFWAYKTLGWGGFWAWDPVENSSLIPWFVSLSLVHGLIIEKRTGALRKTNLLLTAFVFLMVVYGTFLTRSGVLADFSVHSFVDLGINQYLIGFMLFYVGLTLVFFLPRVKSIGHVPLSYNPFNREFALFAGMALLFLFSLVVLFWTSLPITSTFLMDTPRAADLATYNDFALPFAILFALFLTVAPFTNYTDFKLKDWKARLLVIFLASAVLSVVFFFIMMESSFWFVVLLVLTVTIMSLYLFKSDLRKALVPAVIVFVGTIPVCLLLNVRDELFILFFATVAMALISNLIGLSGYLPGRWRLVGGPLAHFGFGIMLIGVLASSAYTTDERLVIPRGQSRDAYGLKIAYNGMENSIEHPKNRLLISYEEGAERYEARPQLYFSERMNSIFRKPYIQNNLAFDLYFSPEQLQENEDQNGLTLVKGEPKIYEGYEFTFKDYAMGEHNPETGMLVKAVVEMKQGDSVKLLEPSVQVVANSQGNETKDLPAYFGENNHYAVSIAQILADRHAVKLAFTGMNSGSSPDRLILVVSKKPFINFVWGGTVLIMIGSLIVFIRRRSEAL